MRREGRQHVLQGRERWVAVEDCNRRGLTLKRMADELGCSVNTAERWRRQHHLHLQWQDGVVSVPEPMPRPEPGSWRTESATAVALLDAAHDQCRWPLWDEETPRAEEMMVCGDSVEVGSSYCARCRARTVRLVVRRGPAYFSSFGRRLSQV